MKPIFLLFLLLGSFISQAQRLQGSITDQQAQPLGYVNIGVVGKDVGTVSTANGTFTITFPAEFEEETVQVSAIGYATRTWKVKDFRQQFSEPDAVISLKEQAVALQEVVVRPRKYVTKVVGNTTTSKTTSAGFKSNKLGSEVGIALKIKNPSFLEKVTFNIAHNQYDTLFLRINVYRMTKEGPENNLLREPIYLNVAKKEIGDGVSLDLRDRNIYLESDVLVSLELVRDLGNGGLNFSAGIFNSDCYVRSTSQSTWEKLPLIGLGFNATISYAK
ncbi:carboxypeptidase-like regulatory domain-containing protein [Rufibacter latericius]|uniref:Carboxypeptidase-like regulatory domain-containing protein n=1 Tax=Rufibacter latericius TaxID=2487040 RepID=A0A3M9N065_9BACT|nr:carboxypeptidase-like regulatory domain-containing protein [Rufibacter latericius]RNI31179.1 carboxypeptidase-like regulatory domain-containing protein [Rufibacter latericius]